MTKVIWEKSPPTMSCPTGWFVVTLESGRKVVVEYADGIGLPGERLEFPSGCELTRAERIEALTAVFAMVASIT